ncbi:autotransporter outer membrane beta-barrel domain-containing protein [Ochrobactrum sp. MYb68]|nr:autotransporter outer membrane beta-barrel domain-containing protein [Ochrobactrum sp. MYb68]
MPAGRIEGLSTLRNDGSIEFNQTGAAQLDAAIPGTGQLRTNSGTTSLTGSNTYTGGTWIGSGSTLNIGANGASGDLLGLIAVNGTLVFERSDTSTFSGTLSGAGHVSKSGAGTLHFDGNSTAFSGITNVAAGALIVGSDITHGNAVLGGSLLVSDNAILGGHGIVGSGTGSTVTIASGGTLSPGNSTGTLIVNGDLILSVGSTYLAEIHGDGTADRVNVSGTATLSGSHLVVTTLDASTSYQNGQNYRILNAADGVSGTFADAVTQSAFLTLGLDYSDPNAVDLTINLNNGGPGPVSPLFSTVAHTRNQRATAGALDTLAQSGPSLALYNHLLMMNAVDARMAFNSLSGEIHSSAKTALIEDSHFVRDAANDRIRAAFGDVAASSMPVMTYAEGGPILVPAPTDRFAVWGHGFGGWGHSDRDGNAARLNHSTGGFLVGADAPVFDTWRFGVLAGYSHTSFNGKDRFSSGSSDNYHLGLYGGSSWAVLGGQLGFRSGLAYTWHDIDASRSVMFPGFSNSLTSDYDAGTYQAFGELGYRIDTTIASFEPFANLAYVNLDTDGFTEHGSAAALSVGSQSTDTTFTTLGLRASSNFTLGGVDLMARGLLGWRHAFGDNVPVSTQAFTGSDAFTIAGVPIAKDSVVIETGLDLSLAPTVTLGLSYSGQIASSARQHGFKTNFRVRF